MTPSKRIDTRRRRVLRRGLLFLCLGWFVAYGSIVDIWGKRFADFSPWLVTVFFVNALILVILALYVAAMELQDAENQRRRKAKTSTEFD